MGYHKAHIDLDAPQSPTGLAQALGLQNLGLSVHILKGGEGYNFFHNHREQEEVYFCLDGTADLLVGDIDNPEHLTLQRGDAVRVDARTLRALGNRNSERAVVLISGACPHPYPAGVGHHDVIADLLSITGEGKPGFELPPELNRHGADVDDEDC